MKRSFSGTSFNMLSHKPKEQRRTILNIIKETSSAQTQTPDRYSVARAAAARAKEEEERKKARRKEAERQKEEKKRAEEEAIETMKREAARKAEALEKRDLIKSAEAQSSAAAAAEERASKAMMTVHYMDTPGTTLKHNSQEKEIVSASDKSQPSKCFKEVVNASPYEKSKRWKEEKRRREEEEFEKKKQEAAEAAEGLEAREAIKAEEAKRAAAAAAEARAAGGSGKNVSQPKTKIPDKEIIDVNENHTLGATTGNMTSDGNLKMKGKPTDTIYYQSGDINHLKEIRTNYLTEALLAKEPASTASQANQNGARPKRQTSQCSEYATNKHTVLSSGNDSSFKQGKESAAKTSISLPHSGSNGDKKEIVSIRKSELSTVDDSLVALKNKHEEPDTRYTGQHNRGSPKIFDEQQMRSEQSKQMSENRPFSHGSEHDRRSQPLYTPPAQRNKTFQHNPQRSSYQESHHQHQTPSREKNEPTQPARHLCDKPTETNSYHGPYKQFYHSGQHNNKHEQQHTFRQEQNGEQTNYSHQKHDKEQEHTFRQVYDREKTNYSHQKYDKEQQHTFKHEYDREKTNYSHQKYDKEQEHNNNKHEYDSLREDQGSHTAHNHNHHASQGVKRHLVCGSCNELFNLFKNLPRNLRCGHSLCSECIAIQIYRKAKLSCPSCSACTLHIKNIKQCPVNQPLCQILSEENTECDEGNTKGSKGSHTLEHTDRRSYLSQPKRGSTVGSSVGQERSKSSPPKAPHGSKCLDFGVRASSYCCTCKLWVCSRCEEAEHWTRRCSVKSLKDQLAALKEDNERESKRTQDMLAKSLQSLENGRKEDEIFLIWMRAAFQFIEKNQTHRKKELEEGRKVMDALTGAMASVPSASNLPEALSVFQNIDDKASAAQQWVSSADLSGSEGGEETAAFLKYLMRRTLRSLQVKNGVLEMYGADRLLGATLYSELRLEGGRFHLHALRRGHPSREGVQALPVECFKSCQSPTSSLVFLDLSWTGKCHGRLYIRLTGDTFRGRQFISLCVGEGGVSFRGTRFHRVCWKGLPGEHIWTGDYSKGDGSGGESLLPPNTLDYVPGGREVIISAGLVAGRYEKENVSSIFRIYTRDEKEGKDEAGFGQVEFGLEIVKEAVKLKNVSDVVISDCGLVLEM